MKIAIFGEHPDIQPGFCAAMSLSEIHGFASLGHQVTLYIPDLEDDRLAARMEKQACARVDDLPRYGLSFDIKPVRARDDIAPDFDILVWQSYRARHEDLRPQRGKGFISKNFPRFAANTSDRYKRKALGQLQRYDGLALSLQADVDLLMEMIPEHADRFGHVPRGFVPEWLRGTRKAATPRVACDAAVKAEDGGAQAVRHMVNLFKALAQKGRRPEVVAVRSSAKLVDADIGVPALPLLKFYERFIEPAWMYMPCDFRHSIHNSNVDIDAQGRRVHVGLYENQVVEMQMAGAVPLVRAGDVDDEILFDPEVCTVADYEDPAALLSGYAFIVDNFAELSARARAFALERHSSRVMASAWLDLIGRRAT